MLRNQAGDTFLNRMSLIIYGNQEKVSDQMSEIPSKGKKRGSKVVQIYLPDHVFLYPIPNHRLNQI